MPKPYYEHAGITIYHGDCREVLPALGRDECPVVTDPPYGIADLWQGGSGSGWGKAREKSAVRNAWDASPADVSHLLRCGGDIIIWGGNYFALPPSRGWLVWRKEINPALTLGDAELAWTNLDQVIRVFDHPRNKLTGSLVPEHPTAKPERLMSWCIGFVEGDPIDPYMGGGATLVAAKNLGRRAIGIEIEERYCEIAAKRLSQEVLNFG